MIFTLMAVGAAGVVVVWGLVAARRVSLFAGQATLFGAVGVAALATGRMDLSPRVSWGWALLAGGGAGVALYLATLAFVTVVRRWSLFERHVEQIYDQRKGLPLPAALVLAAAVVAPGEELFWRGLFQGRVAGATGWLVAALVTWAVYVAANAASGSLPILAAAVVSGAVWGALALWTHGVLASLLCHSVWTALMVAAPPVAPVRRLHPARARNER
jgi:membrane protease YdiL (CAAX protease family)